MSWTQPLCLACWESSRPGQIPCRVRDDGEERCCTCGRPTTEGIYVRLDPRTVPYPLVESDEKESG